ncbi:MAG: MurR/RpiR family transcriptional regulator, partial [Oscillospiraceae bacterium]|nr:MurR/RpiR family transcriptional regulator [Oscillospiraceae bacterium]
MENVIAERVSRARLSKSLRKIADYLIINPEEIGLCSSSELARRIGVSDSSVTRFARAIGYSGYPEMKSDLYAHMTASATGDISLLSMTERFTANQSRFRGQESIDVFEKVTQRAIEAVLRQNSQEQLDRVVDGLIAAKHHYVFGCRGSKGVAYQCAWLLRFLLDHVIEISIEGYGGIGLVQDIAPGDCLVMFSVTRLYKNDLETARLAKGRGAKLYLFTNSYTSPI